jgi:hypothetical protein
MNQFHHYHQQSTQQFCRCVTEANTTLLNLVHAPNPPNPASEAAATVPVCPFCVYDAQYLVQPYIADEQGYRANPILAKYRNPLSSLPLTTTFDQPLTSQLPFYTTSPPGFYRRNAESWSALDGPGMKKYHLSTSETAIASTDLNAYTDYLQQQLPTDPTKKLQWFEPSSKLPAFEPTPYSNCCELRRMSITEQGGHRGTGLGAFLFFTAMAFAKLVLKYDQLHLSTSYYTMDLAVKFYRRMGLREVFADFEQFDEEWGVSHYSVPFSPRGIQYDLKRWSRTLPWNDHPHSWLQQQQGE